jgi:hypothetical protein
MIGCTIMMSIFRTAFHRMVSRNHVAQVINQRFHHMRRKMRVPLNKKIEPLPVDLSQSAS